MANRKSLNVALQQAAGKAPAEADSTPAAAGATSRGGSPVAPSRVGKKVIAGYFDPAVAKQLKQMAVDGDTTMQALLAEALNELFQKHGKPTLAG